MWNIVGRAHEFYRIRFTKISFKVKFVIFVFLCYTQRLAPGAKFCIWNFDSWWSIHYKIWFFFRRKLSWRKQLNLPRFNYGKYQILRRPRHAARRSTLNSYFWFLLYQDQYFPTLSAQNFKEITKFCLFFVACAAGSCFINRNQFNFPEN